MQPRSHLSCALTALLLCNGGVTGCASLPDTDAILAHQSEQAVRFGNALGPLTAKRSAALLQALQAGAGEIDILERQLLLEQAINDSPLLVGNKTTLLQDGPATYAAMFAAMELAQDHINLESYIFEDDAVGHAFVQLLLKQQRRGVQVNLMVDSVGGINTQNDFFVQLIEAGVAVLEFNPVNPLLARGDWSPNHRDHRKLLVVDGRLAFIGGINISSVYSSGSILHRASKARASPAACRDTDLQIEGPVVAEFQKLFLRTWGKQQGPVLLPKAYFPALAKAGHDIVRAIGSTPDDPYSRMYLTLISAIGNAQRQVYLTNAYFVPDPQLRQALMDAVARGVDVRLILPSYSDSSLVFHAGRAHYADLLASGVQIFERRGALLHAKTAVIDGIWSTVGSSNLDWRSFMDNDELDAVVLGRDFAAQMLAMFAKDQSASIAVDAQMWAQRGLTPRLMEWLGQLWQRWL